MKRKIRIVLVFILSFAITISMGISVSAEDFVDETGAETSINEGQEIEGNESEELEKTEEPPVEPDISADQAKTETPEKEAEALEKSKTPEEEAEETLKPEIPVYPEKPEKPEKPETPTKSETPEAPKDQVDNNESVEEIAPPVAPTELVTEIQIQKLALRAEVMLDNSVSNGDILNYKIILNNNGDLDIAELLVSDDLGLNGQVGNLKSAGEEIINGSFKVDSFNKLEQIENRIDITGEVDGRRIDMSLAFIVEVEIIKGSIEITNDVKGEKSNDQEFDIFIEGPEDTLYVVSLKNGETQKLDDLWLGEYKIRSIPPMNYKLNKEISVKLTKNNNSKSKTIKHTRNNSRWFSNQDTKLIGGEAIAKRSVLGFDTRTKIIEEKRIDEVYFEIEVVVEIEQAQAVPVEPTLPTTPEFPQAPGQAEGSEDPEQAREAEVPEKPEPPVKAEEPEVPEKPEEQEEALENLGQKGELEEPEEPPENQEQAEEVEAEPEQIEVIIPDDPPEEPTNKEDKKRIDEKTKETEKTTLEDEIQTPKDPEEEPINPD